MPRGPCAGGFFNSRVYIRHRNRSLAIKRVVGMHYELLVRSQTGDQDAMLELTEAFRPLLKKYARKLNYEDSYDDLLLGLLEAVRAMKLDSLRAHNDAVAVKYLSTAVHTRYIKLQRQRTLGPGARPFSEFEEWQISIAATPLHSGSDFSQIDLSEMEAILTKKEFFVFNNIFRLGYSAAEIARMCSKTRQDIGQTKVRMLKKLKKYMTGG